MNLLATEWSAWWERRLDAAQAHPAMGLSRKEFRKRMHHLGVVDSLEHFARLYIHLKRASELESGLDYFWFRSVLLSVVN